MLCNDEALATLVRPLACLVELMKHKAADGFYWEQDHRRGCWAWDWGGELWLFSNRHDEEAQTSCLVVTLGCGCGEWSRVTGHVQQPHLVRRTLGVLERRHLGGHRP
eukprot:6492391-Amphidinium_carterae.1